MPVCHIAIVVDTHIFREQWIRAIKGLQATAANVDSVA
jgi:hypothetical protein